MIKKIIETLFIAIVLSTFTVPPLYNSHRFVLTFDYARHLANSPVLVRDIH